MTGVIYARYSSDSQREESIEGQLRECMAYAERSGITIIGNYIDRAMSARTADRPDFQRMINDSEKRLFDAIIVWKLDRFSRDRYDSTTYKHILKKNGVKVISATENISDSPEGILLESLLEGLSEYYSAELSVKIQRGQMENAMKGKNNGGTVPLGLRKGPDGVMELDPITAPIVQEIFQRYDKGESMTDIVASLNERGIRTAKGMPFRIGSLGTVLKNRKYIGEYRYGKIVIPDKLPVIIDVELFDRVQRRMEVNRHAPARAKADEEYLLTTKLFCGHCGRMLAGESGRSRNGEVHYYYKCGGAKRKQGCTLKAVKKRWIERTVVTATITRVLHDDVINRIADALIAYQDKESTLLPSLKQQLRECEKSIQNMLSAIEAGIITPSTKQRLQDLESRREELNVSILQEQLQKPRFTKEQIVAWISRFKYGDSDDLEYQKQIIDTFVNSVYVYDDRLVMTNNYKDGTETISLDAVHQAFGSDLASDAPLHRVQTNPVFCCLHRMGDKCPGMWYDTGKKQEDMNVNLSLMIPRRRSVRAYKAEAIAPAVLDDLRVFMAALVPLIPGAKVEGHIIPTTHGNFMQKWKTPHFIAIFSDGSDDALLNVGFMYQQLDLYAQSIGLGTCWVGLGSLTGDEPVPEGMKLAVMMAIGIPDGVPERTLEDFRRKPMKELADQPDDRLEALRLAPSATNSQPWFVTHAGDTLHIWREELGLIKQRTLGRMNKIDMGIGLSHLYVENPETFCFRKEENPPSLEGQIYIGSVTL